MSQIGYKGLIFVSTITVSLGLLDKCILAPLKEMVEELQKEINKESLGCFQFAIVNYSIWFDE